MFILLHNLIITLIPRITTLLLAYRYKNLTQIAGALGLYLASLAFDDPCGCWAVAGGGGSPLSRQLRHRRSTHPSTSRSRSAPRGVPARPRDDAREHRDEHDRRHDHHQRLHRPRRGPRPGRRGLPAAPARTTRLRRRRRPPASTSSPPLPPTARPPSPREGAVLGGCGWLLLLSPSPTRSRRRGK